MKFEIRENVSQKIEISYFYLIVTRHTSQKLEQNEIAIREIATSISESTKEYIHSFIHFTNKYQIIHLLFLLSFLVVKRSPNPQFVCRCLELLQIRDCNGTLTSYFSLTHCFDSFLT